MKQEDEWTTGHRYFDMTGYWEWRKEQETVTPAQEKRLSVAA
jgi:hypothetical protein